MTFMLDLQQLMILALVCSYLSSTNAMTEEECLSVPTGVVVESIGCFVASIAAEGVDFSTAENQCAADHGRLAILNTDAALFGVMSSDFVGFLPHSYYHVGIEKDSTNNSKWQWYDSTNKSIRYPYNHFTSEGAKFGAHFTGVNTTENLRGYLVVHSRFLPDGTVLTQKNLMGFEAYPVEDRVSLSLHGVLCEYPLIMRTTSTFTTTTTITTTISTTTTESSTTRTTKIATETNLETTPPTTTTSTHTTTKLYSSNSETTTLTATLTTKFPNFTTSAQITTITTTGATKTGTTSSSTQVPTTNSSPTTITRPSLSTHTSTSITTISSTANKRNFGVTSQNMKTLTTVKLGAMHLPNESRIIPISDNVQTLIECTRKCQNIPSCRALHFDMDITSASMCQLSKDYWKNAVNVTLNDREHLRWYDVTYTTDDELRLIEAKTARYEL